MFKVIVHLEGIVVEISTHKGYFAALDAMTANLRQDRELGFGGLFAYSIIKVK
jgi:hypothetical protein